MQICLKFELRLPLKGFPDPQQYLPREVFSQDQHTAADTGARLHLQQAPGPRQHKRTKTRWIIKSYSSARQWLTGSESLQRGPKRAWMELWPCNLSCNGDTKMLEILEPGNICWGRRHECINEAHSYPGPNHFCYPLFLHPNCFQYLSWVETNKWWLVKK